MAARLAIDVAADVSSAVAGLDSVGAAAKRMGDDVDSATAVAANAAPRLDSIASAADNLDSKAGAATGALGALSSGFELVGAEKYAGALQGAALATDFFSGAGQAATLITEALNLSTLKAKASSVAHTAATKAQALATKAMTAGQWLLNAALNANPLGLVVLAIAALVAGLIIAYNKSETFRNIVQGAMKGAQTAIGWVVDKASALVGWFKDIAPSIDGIGSKAGDVFGAVKTAVDIATTPLQTILGVIKDIVEWIAKIDFPDIPDIPGLGRVAGRSSRTPYGADPEAAGGLLSMLAPVTIDARTILTLDGAAILADEAKLARALQPILDRHAQRLGRIVANPRGSF